MVKIDGFDPVAPGVFNIDRTMTNGPPKLTWSKSPSGDVAGYRIVRDTVVFPTGGALVPKTQLNYTDNSLLRDGTVDGPHGYALYAVDQSGNASVQKVVNFFLDSVPPTTPTSPHGARRTGKAIVDLRWAGSSDVVGPHQAPPSGVARYVVRRAVGAPPAAVTAGQLACDVPARPARLRRHAAPGRDVPVLDLRRRRRVERVARRPRRPDQRPRRDAARRAVRVQGAQEGPDHGALLDAPERQGPEADRDRQELCRAPRTLTDGKVVFSGKAAKANVRQSGGTRA